MKVISLYLNTKSTVGSKYAPTDKSNLANVKWSINWTEIFGEYANTNKPCRVRAKIITTEATTLTTANNQGCVRVSLTSQYSNITNGLNLGVPHLMPLTETATSYYLDLDTTIQTSGMTVNVPMNNDFFVQFLKPDDKTLQPNVPEYQLYLYFDIDEDNDD